LAAAYGKLRLKWNENSRKVDEGKLMILMDVRRGLWRLGLYKMLLK
jgi:hypothetical protein